MAFESGSQDHLEPGKPKDERRIVICIDYGTTFTGIAWIHPQAIELVAQLIVAGSPLTSHFEAILI